MDAKPWTIEKTKDGQQNKMDGQITKLSISGNSGRSQNFVKNYNEKARQIVGAHTGYLGLIIW